ncbi:MAG: M48 family metalloprotease [Armatimonadetes bacterium]|nr:M48 family metalloprotease [Armatimonadota bacterium]
MKCRRLMLFVFGGVLAGLAAAGPGRAAQLTLEQEAQAGRGFVNAFTEQYGLSENQEYHRIAREILLRLARASGERPEVQWRAVVLKYNPNNPVGKNASAWPGGYLVTDEEFMRTIQVGSGGDPARMEALVAGVIAHEMAHVIRRDTDALVPLFFRQATPTAPQLLMTLKSTDAGPKTGAAEQRQKEDACDRHGAFYLLRAGYEIQDMIDVFRRLADEEVDEVLFSSELDHARAGERVGNLLEVKTQVTDDERLYDEAVNILNAGLGDEMLAIAARNLESIAVRFPKVLPIRHARAVLAHRRFIAKMPPEKLVYMPSFSFYRFKPTRAFADDFLIEALREYEAILKDYEAEGHKGLGPTVAAYALALTHAGEKEQALTWAQKGVQLAPEDWSAHNVLGIALKMAGKGAEAVAALRKAVELAAPEAPKALVERSLMTTAIEERTAWRYLGELPPVDFGPALYNLGLALKDAGDKAGAARAFQAFAALDSRSDWGKLAQTHLKAVGGRPLAEPAPISGVTIDMSDVALSKKLGEQRDISPVEPGGQVWRYKTKGFSLFLDEGGRVRAGMLYAPYAGEIGPAVRIDAAAAQVEQVWGKPLKVARASTREAWSYPAYGLTFLMNRGKLAKVLWSPAPRTRGATVASDVPVRPGDRADRVKAALGAPDTGEGEEGQGGAWVYDRLGVRVRFDRSAAVALVTVTRPSHSAVEQVRLGDPAGRIRQLLGSGFVTADVDRSETHSFPDRGVSFVVRNAEIAVINLFPRQS